MKVEKYLAQASRTSRINWATSNGHNSENGADIAALGLLDAIGGLASAVKKKYRDKDVYASFDCDFEEKLGSLLWYLVNIAINKQICIHKWPEVTQTNKSLHSQIFDLNTTSQ